MQRPRLGLSKTRAAASRLRLINPNVEIEPVEARIAGVQDAREIMRFVRGYAAFCAVSFVALSYAVSVLYLPVLMRFVLGALRGLSSGPAHAAFWDATGFLTVTLGSLRTLIGVSIRDVRRRRRETRSTRGMRSYG